MHAVRTLLEGILDYAGLFPPAKLDMAPTVRNFDAYRRGTDAWFLGRLVVPVARLAEFEAAAETLLPKNGPPGDDDAWPITALTAPAGDAQLARDLDLIAAFNDRHAAAGAGSALIDCIEVKATTSGEIDAAIDLVPDDLFPYFELPASPDPRGLIATLAGLDAGAKIRTGGVTADAHPSPEDVARFLVACAAAEVPFKATAGLHHPLRHVEASVGCRQHGFLNVFVGAALVWNGKIDERALAELLAEESTTALALRDDAISWRSTHVSAGELRATRDAFAHSFGSCSFDEPLADLRAMRALAAAGANA
ncbi:MAG: hypothetical protein JNM94_12310 [Phycisphaerae bacterium]|nr:hypothetical protein [Phycisphaerae bacterium]